MYHFNEISHLIFSLMTYYFLFSLVYICFILMEMILDKKYIWVIFLSKFKVAHKLAGTTWTPRIHLAQELLPNTECSGDSRGFAKVTRTLIGSNAASHWILKMTVWVQLSKQILLQLYKSAPKTPWVAFHYNYHLKQNWKNKNAHMCVPYELTRRKTEFFV